MSVHPNPHVRSRQALHGFTLIELLVVITILVVLLALIAPALDRAVYRAELVICATNQRAAVTGVLTYAMESRRRYPSRNGVNASGGFADNGWQPQELQRGEIDDRPLLRPYVTLNKQLNCPLTPAIDLDSDQPNTAIYGAYALWWGWDFISHPGGAMAKVGDRLVWEDNTYGRFAFNILMSDHDLILDADKWGHGTHPDADGKAVSIVRDQSREPQVPASPGTPPDLFLTLTRWQLVPGTGADRGPIEMNVTYQDGSSALFENIPWDARRHPDEGFAGVPFTAGWPGTDGPWEGYWVHLPRR